MPASESYAFRRAAKRNSFQRRLGLSSTRAFHLRRVKFRKAHFDPAIRILSVANTYRIAIINIADMAAKFGTSRRQASLAGISCPRCVGNGRRRCAIIPDHMRREGARDYDYASCQAGYSAVGHREFGEDSERQARQDEGEKDVKANVGTAQDNLPILLFPCGHNFQRASPRRPL